MKRSTLILTILSLIWIIASSFYYLNRIKGKELFAEKDIRSSVLDTDAPEMTRGIWYKGDEIHYGDSFRFELMSILDRIGEFDTLHLVATYSDEGEDNLDASILRARQIMDSIGFLVEENNLKISSIKESGGLEDWKEAVHFSLINSTVPNDPMMVRFEEGTVVKIIGDAQNERLHELAVELIGNPSAKFDVIGHTNSIGSEEENYLMGRKRAWAVKKLFMDMGVEPSKLVTESKGSLEPHDDPLLNDRVEISWRK